MDKMLDKKAVKEMADLFFNGQPEKAYTMCKDSNENYQFINSIKKSENQEKAYLIMSNSDLTAFYETPVVPYKEYPTYDIGY